MDPNNHNGAVFLGLGGLVVKSHGGANARGLANAIGVAHDLVVDDIGGRIAHDMQHFHAHRSLRAGAPAGNGSRPRGEAAA